jgi:LuxR family maltose regulon positive regulatory protein
VADRTGTGAGRALDLLGRLLGAAQDGGRVGSVIEILVVEALAHQRLGDDARALACLEAALDLGEAEGHVAAFRDEGAPMAALLSAAAERGTLSPYRRRLRVSPTVPSGTSDRPDLAMLDPLSSRERDVLRFLGTELNGPEIARELVVSLNTVRTHTKSIYLKLGVNNRRAAVRRARELDLL